jgi:hypothetical protein
MGEYWLIVDEKEDIAESACLHAVFFGIPLIWLRV